MLIRAGKGLLLARVMNGTYAVEPIGNSDTRYLHGIALIISSRNTIAIDCAWLGFW